MLTFIRKHGIPIAIIILIVLNSTISFNKGYASGRTATQAYWQGEYSKLLLHSQRLTEQTASLQHSLDTQLTSFERRSNEEKQVIVDDYERRLAAVSHRVERVYIPARIPPDYCDTIGAAAATTAPAIRETRCELDPAVVERLASIARDGDLSIIERNDLIDRYNAARAALMHLQDKTP